MGYRRQKRTIKLVFEDPELAGLEVRARSISISKMLELDRPDRDAEELFRTFATSLIDWNLEDDNDQPVPATYEGLMEQDPDFALQMVHAWMDGVVSISGPLSETLSNGQPSPDTAAAAPSIPMEPLPANPLS